jgi:hypothetical protein
MSSDDGLPGGAFGGPAGGAGERGASWSRTYRRPYALTRGRTRSHADLELETLISTAWLDEDEGGLDRRQQAIIRLCREVLSVAEVSARLDIPLGVAKVLIGDLADEGLLHIYRTGQPSEHRDDAEPEPDVALLARVLDGLRGI